MVSSWVNHQVSTSFLVGKLGSSFVSVGSVYCSCSSMKTFVTFQDLPPVSVNHVSVCLPTCLYTDTLNYLWKYAPGIDRTSFLCELTHTEVGGRVIPLSPGVVFVQPLVHHCSQSFYLPVFPSRHFEEKNVKKKTLCLSLSQKIILWSSDSHQKKKIVGLSNFRFSTRE